MNKLSLYALMIPLQAIAVVTVLWIWEIIPIDLYAKIVGTLVLVMLYPPIARGVRRLFYQAGEDEQGEDQQ